MNILAIAQAGIADRNHRVGVLRKIIDLTHHRRFTREMKDN
jgi:hypothetical protein